MNKLNKILIKRRLAKQLKNVLKEKEGLINIGDLPRGCGKSTTLVKFAVKHRIPIVINDHKKYYLYKKINHKVNLIHIDDIKYHNIINEILLVDEGLGVKTIKDISLYNHVIGLKNKKNARKEVL